MDRKEELLASEEHQVRLDKVNRLREQGYNPWPPKEDISATCQQVIDEYVEGAEKEYSIAGRVMTIRDHGKTIFCTSSRSYR